MRPPAVRHPLTLLACAVLSGLPGRAQDAYDFTTLARVGSLISVTGGNITALLPTSVTVDDNGAVYFLLGPTILRKIAPTGALTTINGNGTTIDGSLANARIAATGLLATDTSTLLLAELGSIRRASLTAGTILPLAGSLLAVPTTVDGIATQARFGGELSLALEADGNVLVADIWSHTIRRLILQRNGAPLGQPEVTTIAGMSAVSGSQDGYGSVARFFRPTGVASDSSGTIYVYDLGNGLIRKIAPSGSVTTLAGQLGVSGTADGTGDQAQFGAWRSVAMSFDPGRIVIDANGNVIVADPINHLIRKVTPDGVVTTIGGALRGGSMDGVGTTARFNRPTDIAIDRAGNLYIADQGNGVIRKGTPVWRPAFRVQPQGQAVDVGQTVTLTVDVTGTPAPALQWRKDGADIPGATGATFSVANAQPSHSGAYTVVATNAAGAVTSTSASLVVGRAPVIVTSPSPQTIAAGAVLTLRIEATGVTSVQWLKDGVAIPGATSTTYTVVSASAADAGNYAVVLTNSAGSITSAAVPVVVNVSRIVNLSIRSTVTPAAPLLTVGFVVSGTGKTLLVRGVGPTLRPFGIPEALADPRITMFAGGTPVVANDNWNTAVNAAQVADTAAQVGAFALPAGSADAAILSYFQAGGYSAQVSAPAETSGIVLVELYDANPASPARLANVSTRAQVGTGDNLLVAGFVIAGNARKTLLIRAAGPTLATFGVPGTLADPKLDLIAGGRSGPIATNDNWGGAEALASAFVALGAFPFSAPDSKDAAMLVTLDPGSYSVQVSGIGGGTGEALVEIYDVP